MTDIKHYDAMNQEIKVGAVVVRSTGQGAGFDAPSVVAKLTPKMIKLGKSAVDPSNVIVIDDIIKNKTEEDLLTYLSCCLADGSPAGSWRLRQLAGRAYIIAALEDPSQEILVAAAKLLQQRS